MTAKSKGPFCPECATVMRIVGQTQRGVPTYRCPSCNYESHIASGTTKEHFLFGQDFPPGEEHRCLNCGAFTFGGPFGNRTVCRRCGASNPNASQQPGMEQQPVSPQVVYVSTPVLVQPPYSILPETRADTAKPGCAAVGCGIITMIISAILFVVSLFGVVVSLSGYADHSGATLLGVALSCLPALFLLFGVVSGALLAFGKGSTGKILSVIFWVILLVGGVFVGVFLTLLLGGGSLFS